MSQGDGLVAVGLLFGIVVYAMFSTLDLPTLLGSDRRLPASLQLVHESLAAAFRPRGPSPARVLTEFLAVVATTQFIPVIMLARPEATVGVKMASVAELVLALSWTFLLVIVGIRRTDA